MLLRVWLIALCLILPWFSRAEKLVPEPAPSRVTRAKVMEIAERYLRLEWKARPKNILHGTDAAGIRIDTPDVSYQPKSGSPGWWHTGTRNEGMPYKWGGFDTPESFLAGVKAGKAAGDLCTLEKRRLLEAAVSDRAVGIDCSGFISRCWGLPRAYSTRTLPSLCLPLKSYAELRPGDVLNVHNSHVLLFAGWALPNRSRLLAYETGSPPTWKVLRHSIPMKMLREQGYRPMRYRGIVE